jgi:hypothetical protein
MHIECKRCQAGSLYGWLDQATKDAGENVPVVMHRRNGCEWVAILPLRHFLALIRRLGDRDNHEGEQAGNGPESNEQHGRREAH